MATNLYEVLEITKDASPEQIRKAYKRKALQTHPDRLSPTATAEEKALSEEQFRKINNAYEVLTDSTKRREYDLHGVWPPPEPEDDYIPNRPRSHSHYHGYSSRNNAFQGPFYGQPSPFSSFGFSDPFALFDSIFGDSFFGDPGSHRQPSHYRHPHRSASSWPEDPFEHVHRMHADISMNMRRMEQGMLFGMGGGLLGGRSSVPTLESSSSFDNGRTRWASESYMTSAVNGVSQTIHKRRDWDGNEHVTRTYADGREVHTMNGVEQPRGYVAQPRLDEQRRSLQQGDTRYLPPLAIGQNVMTSRSDYPMRPPPPPYPGNHCASPADGRRRDRRSSEKHVYIPNTSSEHLRHDRHDHKRWWD